jgi:hypothetical protein
MILYKIKRYFRALKTHPGIPTATIISVMITAMVFSRCNPISFKEVLIAVIGGLIGSLPIWLIILVSNIDRNVDD